MGSLFYEFLTLSNELSTPKLLLCPADKKKRAATDFSSSINGGLVNAGFRDNSVSYFISLDAGTRVYNNTTIVAFAEAQNQAVVGDSDFHLDVEPGGGGTCSAGVNVPATILTQPLSGQAFINRQGRRKHRLRRWQCQVSVKRSDLGQAMIKRMTAGMAGSIC